MSENTTFTVLEKKEIDSSTIKTLSYTDKGDMIIEFLNGTEYLYSSVPKNTFEDMSKSESVGGFLAKNIKGKFEYRKLEKPR